MNQFTQNYIFVELMFWVLEGDFFLQEVSPIKYVNTNGRTIKLNLNLEWRVFAVEAPNRALDFNTWQTFSQAITKQNAHAHNIQKLSGGLINIYQIFTAKLVLWTGSPF